MAKRYLSLWLPRLSIDRIERTQPELATAPMAAVIAEQGRLILLSVNAVAAQSGVAPGMTLSDGRTLCPNLRAAEADPVGDRAALEALVRWSARYTPWTATDPVVGPAEGGVFLDISGCAHLFGGEEALLADLSARLNRAGLNHRLAVAGTVGAAWALARFGDHADGLMDAPAQWPILPPGPPHEALAPLPVHGLRLPAANVETLARLGLYRIGDLYGIPRAALTVRFGPGVRRRLDQALGHEAEAISPALPPAALRVSRAFPEPLLQPEAVALVLDGLLADLCTRLEAAGRGARRLTFTLCRADGTVAETGIGVSRPSRDPGHLARLFAPRLETLDPDPGVDMLVLGAETSDPHQPAQRALKGARHPAGQPAEATGHLDELIDRLANRLGGDRVFWQAPQETPVPEAQTTPAPALTAAPPDWSAWPDDLIAPPRLFTRPEPVELAPVAGRPCATIPPDRFVWRHKLWRSSGGANYPESGPYAGLSGPARVLGPWWQDDFTARDYFLVEAAANADEIARLWLFQDLTTCHWHVHGVFG